jgi:NADH-quinone oxidoreductase subunit L
MFRLLKLTFHGEERFDPHHVHPHESPKTMTIPLIILAVLSALGGFLGIPYALGSWFSAHPNLLENFLEPVFEDAQKIISTATMKVASGNEIHFQEYLLMLISTGIALSGIYLANKFYSDALWSVPRALAKNFRGTYNLLFKKYKLDEFYFATVVDPCIETSRSFLWKIFDVKYIDGLVNGLGRTSMGIGETVRKLQTGIVQNYAVIMTGGIILILFWIFISL